MGNPDLSEYVQDLVANWLNDVAYQGVVYRSRIYLQFEAQPQTVWAFVRIPNK